MNIGFMQGRLCDQVDGKIQAFPWRDWEKEFPIAKCLNIRLMEWTLDQDHLYENPLMTEAGRKRIKELSKEYGICIHSLTGDCFMQAPFYKAKGVKRARLLNNLQDILDASHKVGIRYVLLPLVDNGSLETPEHEIALLEGVMAFRRRLVEVGMKILFESDFSPKRLTTFIDQLPEDAFGLNYDIGNSAALGFAPIEEIASYGHRIDNVHVKDRELSGTTVPLGSGNADFPAVFRALHKVGYAGYFILQTARALDGDHAGALARYRDMTYNFWMSSGS